jgi:hypothetical protein
MFLFPVEKFYGASGRLFSTGAEIEISSCFKTQLNGNRNLARGFLDPPPFP